MAYGFGTGVQAGLGATDYSNYLRGALAGAEMSARGQAGIAQGIASAGQQINALAQQYMQKKEKREKEQMAVAAFQNIASANPDLAKQLGVNPDDPQAVKYIVNGLGIAESFSLASLLDKMNREAKQTAAFQAGISAIPDTIIETNVPTVDIVNLRKRENFTAPTSFLLDTPQQSVEDFMQTGKITPQAPAMAIDMVSKQPAAPAAAPEAPAIKPVPENIKQYYGFNAQTGSLVPTRRLEQDTLAVTSDFQKLEQEKEQINSILERKYKRTNVGVSPTGMPVIIESPLSGEDIIARNQRLAEIEKQQAPLKDKLIELGNVRQAAADFGKQPDKKPSVEETASNVIDRSLRFAEEVNLDPVDKNQWLQMKTVLKDIPRKATDGEKIAAFVKAYGEIAPIDSSVYFKMKQLFDTTPVITDLGGGNQLVTAGGQSYLIRADKDKPVSVAQQEYDSKDDYADLVLIASKVGEDALRANHPQLYNQLVKLHIKIMSGKTNSLGFPLTIKDSIASVSGQPATNVTATTSGNNVRSAADSILAGR
jgi:hypothetical protein